MLSPKRQSARMSKIRNNQLNPNWHGMLCICTYMAAVGVKGLMSKSKTNRSLRRRPLQPSKKPGPHSRLITRKLTKKKKKIQQQCY